MSESCQIVQNREITGLGVRIALYVQSFVVLAAPALLPDYEISRINNRALWIGTALELTAIIQMTTSAGLSLLDALIVLELSFLIVIGPLQNLYSRKVSGGLTRLAQAVFDTFHCALGLYVWVHVRTFGASAQCNPNSSVKFLILFISIRATAGGLRGFEIFLYAFSTLAIVQNGLAAYRIFRGRGVPIEEEHRRRFVKCAYALLGLWGYQVAAIEVMIQRNHASAQVNQWGFGQTLAVIILVPSLLDTCKAILRLREPSELQYTDQERGRDVKS